MGRNGNGSYPRRAHPDRRVQEPLHHDIRLDWAQPALAPGGTPRPPLSQRRASAHGMSEGVRRARRRSRVGPVVRRWGFACWSLGRLG